MVHVYYSCGTSLVNKTLKFDLTNFQITHFFYRLDKLLRKNKFEEAEDFCEKFGLDVEAVYKAKSRYLCDKINPWRSLSGNSTVADLGTSR